MTSAALTRQMIVETLVGVLPPFGGCVRSVRFDRPYVATSLESELQRMRSASARYNVTRGKVMLAFIVCARLNFPLLLL
jgi:hypothetical protein